MSIDLNPYAAPAARSEDQRAGADAPAPEVMGPKGIGGWLILPLIGLCFTPVILARELSTAARMLEVWDTLTTPGSGAYHPLWGASIVFDLAGGLLLLAFTVVVAIHFFRKSRHTPRLMIAWLVARVAFPMVSVALTGAITSTGLGGVVTLTPMVLGSVLWSAYFVRSVRVKNTFVR
jgi:hypothetical protein